MNSKYRKLHAVSLAAGCWLMLSACSSEDRLSADSGNEGKTPIELTVGIVGDNPSAASAKTRTIITTDAPYGRQAQAFGAETSLYMVIKGDNADGSGSKYTKAIGTVAENSNDVSFADGYKRYWEDGYARASKLSVYSACVPGMNNALTFGGSNDYNSGNNEWSSSEISSTIAWPLTGVGGTAATQDADFLANQDLCFSNNVSKYTISASTTDNRMVFNESTKKFEARQLIFHHALTKVTFRIKKGDGFGNGDNEFKFTDTGKNIQLVGFNSSGTLNISTGEFVSIGTATIDALAKKENQTIGNDTYAYVLEGLMLPGSVLSGTETDKINLTIDGNTYHVTKDQLKMALYHDNDDNPSTADVMKQVGEGTSKVDALTNDFKMRSGVHYIFTLTVGKKAIDNISAKVVDWETVTAAETTPTNARISVSLLVNGTLLTGQTARFDLYRLEKVNSDAFDDNYANYEWGTGYVPSANPTANKAHLVENTSVVGEYAAKDYTNHNTSWYWPNNKTFYHFRTVMPKDCQITEDTAHGDYITLTGGGTIDPDNSGTGSDICWGAPFNALSSGAKLVYTSDNGFDKKEGTDPNYTSSQISKAIGPTNDKILMEMFHMMSDVTIKLTTSEGDDAVNLNLATIKLNYIYPNGKVRMGNGKVEPDGTAGEVSPTLTYDATNNEAKVEHYGFVPQDLLNVVLTITTPDGNQYFQNMKDVVTSSYSNTLIANPYTDSKITRWYPNFKYIYTFKLTKSDISLISATLANWETVEAGNDNVQIQ